ncbi:glycosyltransferase involved in cell wall biosynthesis [Okibacterium sp. HSC-33S16]|uniref:glycosyltransferase n=1 Tax=Okibacterium sp. HSC-33S16 TaxID=2910965 RepID=UPI0020A152D4|nr:glycosyltransferase [Okibacterium sp. HSC-33S16]MCP2032154.1 glycosyltransferase involved in cell wall biosynthesis [Okibacterium sp. HSC-33S16]
MVSTPRVSILALNYPPEPTGISPYIGSFARGLRTRGIPVRVYTAHPHYPEWEFREGYGQWSRHERIDEITVTRFRHYIPRTQDGIQRLLSEISFGLRLAFAHWGRPDVIVLVSPALFATSIATIRARLSRRKPAVVIWVQDIYSLGVIETGTGGRTVARVMKSVESATLRAASGVVVIHSRFSSYITDTLGVDPERVQMVRNWTHLEPLPAPDVDRVRTRHGWGAAEIVVLHAGNMGAKQGLENVVEAARLADARKLPVRFVLLGNGSKREHLEKLAERVARLQFIDPLNDGDFQDAIASADVLLVNEKPGVSEMAVPSKLTSYFSTGRPVLAATDPLGTTAGEIMAAQAGVVVTPGDPQALVDTALALGNDPGQCRMYGSNGQRYRDEVLGEKAAIDRYAEWLRSLAEKRARPVSARLPNNQGGDA